MLFGAPQAWSWQCTAAQVLRIHDGDTITLRCGEGAPVRVRFANIDAPELHQAYGMQARDDLVSLIGDDPVSIESRAVDRYDRTIATVGNARGDLGLLLVEHGYAWCGMRPTRTCREAMQAARDARRGLWTQTDPQPPWQWRRAHPRTD